MNRQTPTRKKLVQVAIGAYDVRDRATKANIPRIREADYCIREGALYDQRLGNLGKPGWPECTTNHLACTGQMGVIPLPVEILNPFFEAQMLQYLSLFTIAANGQRLEMRRDVGELVQRHRYHTGFRRIKAIAEDMPGTSKWKRNLEIASVSYEVSKDNVIGINATRLRQLLEATTAYHTSEEAAVKLQDLGLNPKYSRPEQYIIGAIPILPNLLRAPLPRSEVKNGCISRGNHPFTSYYHDIVNAANSGEPSRIRIAYLDLIKGGSDQTLKSAIFSSDKHGFIRGSMYSKVGGQVARSVIAPNPRMKPTEVGYPRRLALENSYRILVERTNMHEIEELIAQGHITHTLDLDTGEYIRLKDQPTTRLVPGKTLVLRELQDGDVVIMNRQPTLHRNSMLGFIVRLHDDDVFYIHPSATKGFGADFDGDEMNGNVPYRDMGQREARELMFVTFHMASLASSSLLVGYHQDVNLAAHILSMDGTRPTPSSWEEMMRISWESRWKDLLDGSGVDMDTWIEVHKDRCITQGVDPYSGRGLYSSLLPVGFDWSMGDVVVRDGILVDGILTARNTSGSGGSMGMVIYRTYGADETVWWLNGSYRMLNMYLIRLGVTMGIHDLILPEDRQDRIEEIKDILESRQDLQENVEAILDPVIRARRESEIIQELNNARETISVLVMDSKDRISGHFDGDLQLWHDKWVFNPMDLPRPNVQVSSSDERGKDIWTISGPGHISINLYRGRIELSLDAEPGKKWIWSMAIFPRVVVTLTQRLGDGSTTQERIDREYSLPNSLKMMIESGARGNSTNAIQIAGIVGQQAYEGGRIPRMMEGGSIPGSQDIEDAKRSAPCYPFGDNSVESRGFIRDSYIQGLGPEEYMNVHVSSRENLTSNVSLTPKTGYFGRRVRTFTENLRVARSQDKTIVVNERGMVAMWDYIMDPSRVFTLNGRPTFMDVSFELRRQAKPSGKRVMVLTVPFRQNLKAYISMDPILRMMMMDWMSAPGESPMDLVVILDPRVQSVHQDYKEYIRDIVPREPVNADGSNRQGNTMVISPQDHESWILKLQEYSEAIIIPLDTPLPHTELMERLTALAHYPGPLLGPGIVASVDTRITIGGPGYRGQSGSIIPLFTLYQMLIYGTQFQRFPYIVAPSRSNIALIPGKSLLQNLIIQGHITFL